jgi:hypothetical protein
MVQFHQRFDGWRGFVPANFIYSCRLSFMEKTLSLATFSCVSSARSSDGTLDPARSREFWSTRTSIVVSAIAGRRVNEAVSKEGILAALAEVKGAVGAATKAKPRAAA